MFIVMFCYKQQFYEVWTWMSSSFKSWIFHVQNFVIQLILDVNTGMYHHYGISYHQFYISCKLGLWEMCGTELGQSKAMSLFIIIYPYSGSIQLMTRARCIFVYVSLSEERGSTVCVTEEDNGPEWINNCTASFSAWPGLATGQ